jgi:hypothetical protein
MSTPQMYPFGVNPTDRPVTTPSDAAAERLRRLYDGSQASLGEMSARQAEALARVGRLRGAIVSLLRRHFASSFEHAEVTLGSRLSDVDDEVLLAYLTGLVAQAVQAQHLLEQLGSVLSQAGYDPQMGPAELARLLSSPAVAPAPATAADAAAQAFNPQPTGTVGDVLGDILDATQLGDLFADVEPPVWNDPTAGDGFAPSPVKPFARPLVDSRSQPGANAALLGDIFADTAPDDTTANDTTANDTTANDAASVLVTPIPDDVTTIGTAIVDAPSVATSAVSDAPPDEEGSPFDAASPFDDASSFSDGSPFENGTGDFVDASPFDDAPGSFGDEPFSDATFSDDTFLTDAPSVDGSDIFPVIGAGDESQPTTTAKDVPPVPDSAESVQPDIAVGATTPPAATPPVATPPAPAAAPAAPLRPGMPPTPSAVPARSTRRPARRVRTQAKRPEPGLFDAPPAAEPQDMETDLDQRLLAAALVPRPVFVSDLAAMGVDADALANWETRVQESSATSPIRLIHPKTRHRARGSLVYPVATDTTDDSWWASCVRTYRGARVYELGVLLHRVGAELVAHNYGANIATLRLSTRAGLVGLVVVFDSTLVENEPARDDVATHLETMFDERMVLIGVLSTSGHKDAVEQLSTNLAALSAERGWQVSCPVVTARSWEYAADRGSSAVLVLGA